MFQLHLQEFGEFIKRDDTLGALQYARCNLARFSDTQFSDLKRAMALLVFRKRTKCARYLPLLAETRWDDLATLFLQELLRIHGLLELPLLEMQLQVRVLAHSCMLWMRAHVLDTVRIIISALEMCHVFPFKKESIFRAVCPCLLNGAVLIVVSGLPVRLSTSPCS